MKRMWMRMMLVIVLAALLTAPVSAAAKEVFTVKAAAKECTTAETGLRTARPLAKTAAWDEEPILTIGAEQSAQESSSAPAVGKDGSVIPAGWVEIGAAAILIVAVIVVAHDRKEKQKNSPIQ